VAIGAATAGGCGPSLRAAKVVTQEVTEKNGVLVDYPPPPAQVEFVRKDPGPPCVWVDGEWKYVEQTWQWIAGGWYVAPEGCVFAGPSMLWFPDRNNIGKLYYLGGRWVKPGAGDPKQLAACGDATLCRIRR
jgi:hypothetical protein